MAQGYKDFTAGAILTAADLEDYNQNQSIMRFATAAARDSALTTVKTEGMMAYLIDLNTVTVYNGSAWSTIGPVHGALTAWTPAITQSGGVTCTVTRAVYTRNGRWISGTFYLVVTGTGSASNVVTISLPVTAVGNNGDYFVGNGKIYDASTTFGHVSIMVLHSSTTMKFEVVQGGSVDAYLGAAGSTFTAALASGDVCTGQFQYEAAADA